MGVASRRIYKFGVFELGAEAGELWKHGTRIKLQIKPRQILSALLERPGELVTREELCKRLWPAGTFVDFESGLNTATNRLRTALGDSAESPRYIETLPRLGYRFICPVVEIERTKPERIVHVVEARHEIIPEHSEATPEPVAATVSRAQAPLDSRMDWLKRLLPWVAASASVFALLFASGYIRSTVTPHHAQPVFHELTFRAGEVGPGRFTADSQNAIYTAKWTSGEAGTYLEPLQGSESRRLGFAQGVLTAVSRDGNLAFSNFPRGVSVNRLQVYRASLQGGGSEVIADGAKMADWAPDGRELALVREEGPDATVEFPAGHRIFTSHGWLDCLRVSPSGDQVAFFEHPVRDDTAGYVRIVDRAGHTRVLTSEWSHGEGLAWSPSGQEIWFTANKTGARGILWAVSTNGKLRQISNTPSSLRLLDMSNTGRVLLAADDTRLTLMAAFQGENATTDLSKFDVSHVDDISPDGNLVLFTEGGDAGGQHYTTYIHNHRSRSTFPVTCGRGLAISPDGNSIITIDPKDRGTLTITSLASHLSRNVFGDGFSYQWARFLPGGNDLLVGGAYPGHSLVVCKQAIQGGKPIALSRVSYLDFVTLSPDGLRMAGLNSSYKTVVIDLVGGSTISTIPETARLPVAWSKDSNCLYVVTRCESSYMITKLNVLDGRIEPWKTISTGNAGFTGLASVVAAPEAGTYAYSGHTSFSRLYVVDGWS